MPTKKAATAPAKKSPSSKKAPAPSKALVTHTDTKALATSVSDMIAEDAGVGQEGMTRQDYMIPRLGILQGLSPQIKKSKPEYIEGAEEGQICDFLNRKVFSGEDGILVIPVSYRRANIEWKPREKGGGFVKDHGNDDTVLGQAERTEKGLFLPNSNQLSTNGEYFVYLWDPEEETVTPYVLSMASSQLKKSRRWNTMMSQLQVPHPNVEGTKINPAMFYSVFRLSTTPESNAKGDFFGWQIARDGNTLDLPGGADIYMKARDFRKQVTEGKVTASAPTERHTDAEESDDKPM